jgi:hypothetical protein
MSQINVVLCENWEILGQLESGIEIINQDRALSIPDAAELRFNIYSTFQIKPDVDL